ncbi:MAG: hypothetical protein J6U64_02240 [Alphaproteobacteria bacterium]|nr:hypothetical protein [Alphaproteobacteria bacterium]
MTVEECKEKNKVTECPGRAEGCCILGNECCGTVCCGNTQVCADKNKSKCCPKEAPKACGDECCENGCHPEGGCSWCTPEEPVQCSDYCCKEGEICCGSYCCNNNTEMCASEELNLCCPKGELSCCPSYNICGGKCCSKGCNESGDGCYE